MEKSWQGSLRAKIIAWSFMPTVIILSAFYSTHILDDVQRDSLLAITLFLPSNAGEAKAVQAQAEFSF